MSDRVFKQVFNEINESKAPLDINNLGDNTEPKVYEVQGMREFVDSSDAVGEAIDKGIDLALEPETIGSAGQILHNIDIVGLERMLQMRYKKQIAQEALTPEMTFLLINALVILFGFLAKSMGWIEKSNEHAQEITNKGIKKINESNERLLMQLERELREVEVGTTTRSDFEKKWKDAIESKVRSLNTNLIYYITTDRKIETLTQVQESVNDLLKLGDDVVTDSIVLMRGVLDCISVLEKENLRKEEIDATVQSLNDIFGKHVSKLSSLFSNHKFDVFKKTCMSPDAFPHLQINSLESLQSSLTAVKGWLDTTIAHGTGSHQFAYGDSEIKRLSNYGDMNIKHLGDYNKKSDSISKSASEMENRVEDLTKKEIHQIDVKSKALLAKHSGDDDDAKVIRRELKSIDGIVENNLKIIRSFFTIVTTANSFIMKYTSAYMTVYKEVTYITEVVKALEKR